MDSPSKAGQSVADVPEHLRNVGSELVDDDFCVMAIRADRTRGQAKAFFAQERDVPFSEVRVRKTAYRRDLDYEREMHEDGIPEPYDGWPLRECGRGEEGVEFWVFVDDD